ncbi:hypothetical protein BTHE_1011 [Bifidobacterium thermophilum]|nr:hypothetical protein BTHE_1011 [Bifidobacterium thermophilum]
MAKRNQIQWKAKNRESSPTIDTHGGMCCITADATHRTRPAARKTAQGQSATDNR